MSEDRVATERGSTGATIAASCAASLAAPLAANEAERIAALRSYGILDTPTEPAFDDLTRIASQICNTPIAVINLIDVGRQWFKSEIGLGVRETPLDSSICAHAILQPGLFVVPDTRRDPRFARNPLVVGAPHLRFYAGALLQTPEGYPLGTLCVLDHQPRELTETQRATLLALARQAMTQLELRRVLAATSRVNHYRSRVMAELGHDLRQPLQVIAMLLDLITPGIANPTDQRRAARIDAAIDKLSGGLDALAEASRAVLGSDMPRPASVAIDAILAMLIETWQAHADSKGVRLRRVRSSAMIASDPAMLTTILANLVGNAIKYTASGGVLIGCRRRGKMLTIEIVDSGCGIPEDRFDEIFEAFHQLQPHSEGLGLGLHIVRQTAALLGHRLRVASVVGKGSRFSLDVPLAPPRRRRGGKR